MSWRRVKSRNTVEATDDQAAERQAPGARHEQADEHEYHHRGAGFVLVREDAAPVPDVLGLEEVGELVDGKGGKQEQSEIGDCEHDEHARGEQLGEVADVSRQQDGDAGDGQDHGGRDEPPGRRAPAPRRSGR